MNRKYKFHPGEYELGENEKFYGDMEARGWRLVKRGRYLSRFARVEPNAARYRIEVFSPGFLGEPGLPEEQVAVFADCGWEYIDSQSFLHIFRAPAGSGAPEFYADPAQQAETLKKVRRDLWWTIAFSALVLLAALAFCVLRPLSRVQYAKWIKQTIQCPTFFVYYCCLFLWGVCRSALDAWQIGRTYRRLKKGQSMDHSPKGRRLLRRLLDQGLLYLTAASLLLTIGQLVLTRSNDLPMAADGPYLLLGDLGYEGERGTLSYRDRESDITYTRSFLSDYWDVFEVLDLPDGEQVTLYQDVCRLRFPGMAETLAWAMRENAVFARSAEDFHAIEAPGLDGAWATEGMELVAAKGNLVIYVEFLPWDGFDPQSFCAALAERWAK